MKIHGWKVIGCLLLASGCIAIVGRLDLSRLFGVWEVDLDRTTKEITKLSQGRNQRLDVFFGSETNLEKRIALIRQITSNLTYQITAHECATVIDGNRFPSSYSVVTAGQDFITLQLTRVGRTHTNTFYFFDGNCMTNAEDFGIVWKKTNRRISSTIGEPQRYVGARLAKARKRMPDFAPDVDPRRVNVR
jgi:hypothetical protein